MAGWLARPQLGNESIADVDSLPALGRVSGPLPTTPHQHGPRPDDAEGGDTDKQVMWLRAKQRHRYDQRGGSSDR
ncbi:MAG TPA: hypothetical protein VKB55_01150 [Nocardioidaceae bacterium]|nr:hypothetical protein [Nocardioidaceae bacterium]